MDIGVVSIKRNHGMSIVSIAREYGRKYGITTTSYYRFCNDIRYSMERNAKFNLIIIIIEGCREWKYSAKRCVEDATAFLVYLQEKSPEVSVVVMPISKDIEEQEDVQLMTKPSNIIGVVEYIKYSQLAKIIENVASLSWG